MSPIMAVFVEWKARGRNNLPTDLPPADQPGADLTLDPYADLETGARLIGQRADRQLKAIVAQRQRRLA